MALTELKLEYEIASENKKGIPVIIAAAGSSSRMAGVNKQFADLCGIPVIIRTLLAFQRSDAISRIIVVTSKDSINEIQLLCSKYMIDKLTDILEGGANRAESVKKGVARLGEEGYVLIHDGARPLISDEVICRVADALKTNCAVTCAVPLKDTVKKVDRNGVVIETPIREELVAVQTPQGVDVKKYKEALDKADDLSVFTDDMSVMEWAGYSVATVKGDYKNIKITTPEDIIIASALLESEEEE